jgi:uncharacterized protein YecA (UPF0149 family)
LAPGFLFCGEEDSCKAEGGRAADGKATEKREENKAGHGRWAEEDVCPCDAGSYFRRCGFATSSS